ncbi:MAG: zinc-binding dehydrogenase [Candidatus Bathyarchaeia archaeon]
MKAFRFYQPETPWKLENVPIPPIGDGDVLVKIKASGICGTDLHYKHGRTKPQKVPIILGHEISGIIENVGKEVENLNVGDRVCIHYIISCGDCVHCSQGNDNRCRNRKSIGHHVDGGFAEYISIPARNTFKLPDEIPLEQGAIIGCAVSTAFHALKVGEFQPGDTVAVFGLGGVGMHAVMWARTFGASKIIGVDIVDFKLRLAKELGADFTINAAEEDPVKEIHYLTDGWGVDVSLEVAGTEKAMEYAIQSAGGKSPYASGRVVSIAAQFQPISIVGMRTLREGALRKSGDHTRDDLRRVIDLVKAKRIDLSRSVTHRLSFDQLNRGLELLDERKEDVLRIVLLQ